MMKHQGLGGTLMAPEAIVEVDLLSKKGRNGK